MLDFRPSDGATTFTELTDTPSTISAGKMLVGNTSGDGLEYQNLPTGTSSTVELYGDTPDFASVPTDGSVKCVVWRHHKRGGKFYYDANAGSDDDICVFSKWVRENELDYVKLEWSGSLHADDTNSDWAEIQAILNRYPKIKCEKDKVYRIDTTSYNLRLPDYGEIDLNGGEFHSTDSMGSVIDSMGSLKIFNGKVTYTGTSNTNGIKPYYTLDGGKAEKKEILKLKVDTTTGGTGDAIAISAIHHDVGTVIVKDVEVLGAGEAGLTATAHDDSGTPRYIDSLIVENYKSTNTGGGSSYGYGMGITVSGNVKQTNIQNVTIDDYDGIGLENASSGQFYANNIRLSNIKDKGNYAIQESGNTSYYQDINSTWENIWITGGGKVALYGSKGKITVNNMYAEDIQLYGNTNNIFNDCTFKNLTALTMGNHLVTPVFNNCDIEMGYGKVINTDYAEEGMKYTFNNCTLKCYQGDFTSPRDTDKTVEIDQYVWDDAGLYIYKALTQNTLDSDGLPSPAFTDTNAWSKEDMGEVFRFRFASKIVLNNCKVVGRILGWEQGKVYANNGTVINSLDFNGHSADNVIEINNSFIGTNANLSTAVTNTGTTTWLNSYQNGAKVANTAWA